MSPATREVTVFDIDGVLADVSHRLHHLERRPKDWDGFFAAAHLDPPLTQGVELARRTAAETEIAYLTGRPERLREVTQAWLDRHGLPAGRLLMRGSGDRRPARVAKLELLRALHRRTPVRAMVDDDPAVVTVLEEHGFAVLHPTWAPTTRDGVQQPTLFTAQEHDGRS